MNTFSLPAFLLFVLVGNTMLFASPAQQRELIVLSSISRGASVPFGDSKVEAGLAMACELSKKYLLYPTAKADSVQQEVEKKGADATVANVASMLGANVVASVRIDRLQNVLRAEIRFMQGAKFSTQSVGVGYSLAQFKHEKSNATLYDPAILEALQRALCVAAKDSQMFAHCSGVLKVAPAEPLVIGGVEFSANGNENAWRLFNKQTSMVTAYKGVVAMHEEIRNHPRYVAYDVDSRDSIFALFRLFAIENDHGASMQELDALYKLDVRTYVTGSFVQESDSSATLTLHLCSITPSATYTIRKSYSTELKEDSEEAFEGALRSSIAKLLE